MIKRFAVLLCLLAFVYAAPAQDARVTAINEAAASLSADLDSASNDRDAALTQRAQAQLDRDAAISARDQAKAQLSQVTSDRDALKASLASASAAYADLQARSSSSLAVLPTLFENIQSRADWKQAGNTGDSGGGSAKASGVFTVTPGQVSRFTAAGAYAYNNGYFYANLAGANSYAHYTQETAFSFATAADLAASMGVETNFEHSSGSARFNGGLQALFGSDKDPDTGAIVTHVWRWYDIGRNCWRTLTEVPFDITAFAPGKTVDVVQEFERSADGMTFTALTVNGTRYVINRKSAAKASTWSPYLQVGFQLDSKSTPAPYAVSVSRMRVFAL